MNIGPEDDEEESTDEGEAEESTDEGDDDVDSQS